MFVLVTRGITRQKETWWWNEEVAALVKEKQRLFKLWKGPEKCKKRSDVGQQEGEKCAGVRESLETRGVARTWNQKGRQRVMLRELFFQGKK